MKFTRLSKDLHRDSPEILIDKAWPGHARERQPAVCSDALYDLEQGSISEIVIWLVHAPLERVDEQITGSRASFAVSPPTSLEQLEISAYSA